MVADAERLRSQFSGDVNAEQIAQAAVCAAAILAGAPAEVVGSALRLIGNLQTWEKIALDEAALLNTQYLVLGMGRDATSFSALELPHSPTLLLTPSHPPA